MIDMAKSIVRASSPPYRNSAYFPLYDIVLTVDQVEALKGIIGDNYQFLRKNIEAKENLGVSFVNSDKEAAEVKKIEIYLNQIAPNLLDSLEKRFYISFDELINPRNKEVTTTKSDYDVFLCHSSKDKNIVRQFNDWFVQEGLKTWFDEAEILPGDSVVAKIAEGMKKAKYVCVFISDNLNMENKSPYVGWEISLAKTKELKSEDGRVIPILIKKSELPKELLDKNYANFSKDLSKESSEFKRILRKIKVN